MCIKGFAGPQFNPAPDCVDERPPQAMEEYVVTSTIQDGGRYYHYLEGFQNAYNAEHFATLATEDEDALFIINVKEEEGVCAV